MLQSDLQILITGLKTGCKLAQLLKWQHHLSTFSAFRKLISATKEGFSLAEASLQDRRYGHCQKRLYAVGFQD